MPNVSSVDFFFKINFLKKKTSETLSESQKVSMSVLIDTLIVFLKEFFCKLILKKVSRQQEKH